MKTLDQRIVHALDSAHDLSSAVESIHQYAIQHDAVMAQMAEALRDANNRLEGMGYYISKEGDDALSAYQSLGEQS